MMLTAFSFAQKDIMKLIWVWNVNCYYYFSLFQSQILLVWMIIGFDYWVFLEY